MSLRGDVGKARQYARAALCGLLLVITTSGLAVPATRAARVPVFDGGSRLAVEDEALLEDLQRRSFLYFWQEANPKTGLVMDRARVDGSALDERHRNVASIAATGFGLTAVCIAAERRWVEPKEARERVASSLRFFAERAPREHGWFYHWMDAATGERRWLSEVSSIDTALLLAGVLTARGYFQDDPEIVKLATVIYERVDFRWMLAGHPTLLSHGWKPETGFLKSRWDTYSEDTILYMEGIASPTHPLSPRSWYAWRRNFISYAGYTYLDDAPLFIHQYSHAWIDYRHRREQSGSRIDYFLNSVRATRAHRIFCLNLAREFPGYGPNVWGITASDSAKGYVAWGGPPRHRAIDGSVVPSASAGSLMLTPDICVPAVRTMRETFGARIYGRYGFVDAFNPTNGWVDRDFIGIDVGITLLSAENLRTGNVWQWFMRNTEIPRAMQAIHLDLYTALKRSSRRRSQPTEHLRNRALGGRSPDLRQVNCSGRLAATRPPPIR